jgi:glyoxylase-like metal-dependent hydrolase (beta-lactamase superfamily II)
MKRPGWWLLACVVVIGGLLAPVAFSGTGRTPLLRDLELEALQEAVRWPNAAVPTVVALTGRFIAAQRDQEAFNFFQERAKSQPNRPLFVALEGFFQARVAGDVSLFRRVAWVNDALGKLDKAAGAEAGLPRYFRGLVLAELPPRFAKAEAAVADLEWVLQNGERFPIGLRRSVHRGLARAYTTLGRDAEAKFALERSGYPSLDAALPIFTTDYAVNGTDGFRFRPPRVVELAPGVHVAQGYDFGDISFVQTASGVVVIDTGTTEPTAHAALAAFRRVSSQPITHVILTHAHWDHIGGLKVFREPGTQVIAQQRFADELKIVNEAGVPFRYFFGAGARLRHQVVPDRLVDSRETLVVGGLEFVFYRARGGETEDALLIHLPSRGVLFVGDVFMPYLGAPFLPEGSAEGLFETMAVIRSLKPRLLIHGHPPLTAVFPVESLEVFETALQELHQRTRQAISQGRTLVEILHQNILPAILREHPEVVIRYLVTRDNFITRVYHQQTGYWKPDGEGLEAVAPREWAGALNLLAGRQEDAFVRSGRSLLERGDYVLALKIADLGLINYPGSPALATLRRRALEGLRAKHQQLNPFKFVIYSEWAGSDLAAPR